MNNDDNIYLYYGGKTVKKDGMKSDSYFSAKDYPQVGNHNNNLFVFVELFCQILK